MKREDIEEILNKYYYGNSLDSCVDEIMELNDLSKAKINFKTGKKVNKYFIRRVKEKF